ncbi:MAG TPA: hypothetical protein ENI86_13625 [Acidimicrobiales bacterium]|nr:hypothetical protein [Acidimicrobiales bacterium]
MVAAAIQVDLIDAAPVFVGPHDRAEIVARGLREFGLDAVELRRLVVDRPFTLGGAIALSAEI